MNSPMKTNNSDGQSEFLSNLNIIRQIDFFCGMSIEVMKLFAFLCKRQSYKAGDYIFHQNEDDQCCYYVLSGKAKLVLKNNGKEHFIREYKSGNYLGVLSLMTPMVKQFSLVATMDTICLALTRNAFSKIIDQFPDVPLVIIQTLGKRVLQAERKCILELEEKSIDDLKNLLGISLI